MYSLSLSDLRAWHLEVIPCRLIRGEILGSQLCFSALFSSHLSSTEHVHWAVAWAAKVAATNPNYDFVEMSMFALEII